MFPVNQEWQQASYSVFADSCQVAGAGLERFIRLRLSSVPREADFDSTRNGPAKTYCIIIRGAMFPHPETNCPEQESSPRGSKGFSCICTCTKGICRDREALPVMFGCSRGLPVLDTCIILHVLQGCVNAQDQQGLHMHPGNRD